MRIFICATLLVLISAASVHGICTKLEEETWDNLVEMLDFSTIAAIVCPFHIKDEGCPNQYSEYRVDKADPLSLMCGSFFIGSSDACIIDCPTTAFTVTAGRSFTLFAITIRGTEDTAVVVESDATFVAFQSFFEENTSSSNGGAIRGEVNSALILEESFFGFNVARGSGGAIYSNGMIESTKTQYLANRAMTLGGAMAVVQNPASTSSSIMLNSNIMKENRAEMGGPAVFSNPAITVIDLEENTACYNYDESTREFCDGAFDGDSCTLFELSCIISTPSSSVLASHGPSISTRLHPTNRPSEDPSTRPSHDSSVKPTTDFPSLRPTQDPSIKLTAASSLSQEIIPMAIPPTFPTIIQPNGPTGVPSLSPHSASSTWTKNDSSVTPSASQTDVQSVFGSVWSTSTPTIHQSSPTYHTTAASSTSLSPNPTNLRFETLPITPSQQISAKPSDIHLLVASPASSGVSAVAENLSISPTYAALPEATDEQSFETTDAGDSYMRASSVAPTTSFVAMFPTYPKPSKHVSPSMAPSSALSLVLNVDHSLETSQFFPSSNPTSKLDPSTVQSTVPSVDNSPQPSQGPSSVVPEDPTQVQSIVDRAACSANPGCMILGLAGACCPTLDGVLLYCCS